MNPYLFHLCIIALLMIPGIAAFLMEFLTEQTGGGLFQKYTFTKLYWIGLIGYTAITTGIVLGVHLSLKLLKKRLTKLSVLLSHILPVGIVWVSLSLGIHDFIQNKWKERTPAKSDHVPESFFKKQRPSIPQTPLSKQLPSEPSAIPSRLPEEKIEKDPKN